MTQDKGLKPMLEVEMYEATCVASADSTVADPLDDRNIVEYKMFGVHDSTHCCNMPSRTEPIKNAGGAIWKPHMSTGGLSALMLCDNLARTYDKPAELC